MSKVCKHIAIAQYHGRPHFCLVETLHLYCDSEAKTYYVGACSDARRSVALKYLKEFKKFSFCPKCGQKNDYKKVENDLLKAMQ
jgi:NADH pyrophosphatase NudC (nudix superfamily)